ncbi:hypothetical protein GH714_005439 [Hevea brasiliensis]|uniref:DUF1365 domain-containing protein n=1 Tax=Hevea brasiliensis TaxID=3981 RepID=A0A6A6LVG6_HEVBR|nr:hypothetical protein GH714_005439 [Hevea brasiliensis]
MMEQRSKKNHGSSLPPPLYRVNILHFLCLSILLLLRTLLTRLHFIYSTPPPSAGSAAHSHSIYEGTVWHERRHPVRHSFRYSVRYALFDLGNLSKSPPGHLSAEGSPKNGNHWTSVVTRYFKLFVNASITYFLLTIPPSVGYDQNPLSVYYCYDLEGSIQHLRKCIAEDMLGDWRIRANAPGDGLSVSISVQHPELGDYFVATLKAKRISLFLGSDHDLFFWLMPHKVAFWIYWHALKLWWKNVPYIQHPRYNSPKYREEAMARDQKLQCSQAPAKDKDKYLPHDGFCPGNFLTGII